MPDLSTSCQQNHHAKCSSFFSRSQNASDSKMGISDLIYPNVIYVCYQ